MDEPGAVVDRFLDAHPDADLVTIHNQPFSTKLLGHRDQQRVVDEHLDTLRKRVLTKATELGYYEWPRENACEEIADGLGISVAETRENLRGAEQKLIAVLHDKPKSQSTSTELQLS